MRLYTSPGARTKAGGDARCGCKCRLVAGRLALYPWRKMQRPFARYLAICGISLVGVLALTWVYVALAPMAFMESGYATWAAKSTMLRECRLGQVAFFGDSRLEAGVIPAALPVPASNFGLAAGTAVEANSAIRRALACPDLPRQAVIALVPEHFGPLSKFFWALSVRYGFLSPGEVWQAETIAARVGDRQSFATVTPDGLGGRVRDWMYAVRFPSLSFASLVQGRVFARYGSNMARYEAILKARGWANYAGGDRVTSEHPDVFIATGLQTAEFEGAIAALRARGVAVTLLTMPFAQTHAETDQMFAAYFAYLEDVARRFPGVELVSDRVPIWPDRLFADGAHLDAAGAALFSERLAACMAGGLVRPGCDLAFGSAVLEVQQQGNRQH